MWSHAAGSGSTISSITVTMGQPSLLFTYITPKITEKIPRNAMYPYFEVNRYPTTYGNTINSNATATISSSNIQLQSIPRRMYIYARRSNNYQDYTTSDVFLGIEQIAINWNNQAGLLSSADKRSLYNMSIKNGCNLSWEQWSGGPTYVYSGNTNTAYGTVGSVLCVEFGSDIGLQADEAPGVLGTYQLQMDVLVKNFNQTKNFAAGEVTLYVVTIAEGVFNILDDRSVSQIGVISKKDILTAKQKPYVDYHQIENIYGAGNFFTSLKNFGSKVGEYAKKYLPAVRQVAKYIPGLNQYADLGKDYLGYGLQDGGALVGGRKRKQQGGRRGKKRGGSMMDGYDDCEDCEDYEQLEDQEDNSDEFGDYYPQYETKQVSGGKSLPRSILKKRLNYQ